MKNIVKILVVFVMLTSCATENLDLPNQDTSVVDAKMWFDTSKPNLKVLDYTNALDWNSAILSNGDKGKIIEVPLTLKGNYEAKVGDEKSLKAYHRLMFIPDEKERYKAYHVMISTNEKTFDSKNKEFNFYKLNTGFNGYITVLNSKNEITDFDKYQDLKLVSKPASHKLAPAELTCVYYGYLDEFNEFHKISLEFCYEPPGSGGGEMFYGSGSEGGTGGGSGSGVTDNSNTLIAPSCESFKFVSKPSSIWQESAVKNIHFNIVVIGPNGYQFSQIIEFPNAILFGCPSSLQIGDVEISPGLAATLSAKALQVSMDETVKLYGNKPVSELTVRLYFEQRLKHNYPLFIPGGRVNFNASTYTGTATNYVTNAFGNGSCN